MSIKEQLQQILAGRTRQEAEAARRRNEAWELERSRKLAEETKKNAEIQREIQKVKGILDSKGIPKMLEQDVLPILHEMGAVVTLGSVTEGDVVVRQRGGWERIKAMGVVIYGGGPNKRYSDSKYDNAGLGVFIETRVGTVYLCAGEGNPARTQFSLNDRNLKDEIESELVEILSEPEMFSWDNPETYHWDGPG